MDLGDARGHRVQPRQFPPEVTVMSLDDVSGKFCRWQFRRVLCWRRWAGHFSFELLDDRVNGEALARARFAKRTGALAAEINAEGLEHARASGPFGDKFTDCSIGQRSSDRREDGLDVAHGFGLVF